MTFPDLLDPKQARSSVRPPTPRAPRPRKAGNATAAHSPCRDGLNKVLKSDRSKSCCDFRRKNRGESGSDCRYAQLPIDSHLQLSKLGRSALFRPTSVLSTTDSPQSRCVPTACNSTAEKSAVFRWSISAKTPESLQCRNAEIPSV